MKRYARGSSFFISTLISSQHHNPKGTHLGDIIPWWRQRCQKSLLLYPLKEKVPFLVQTLHPLILKPISLFFIYHSLTRVLWGEKQGVPRASVCEDGTPPSLMDPSLMELKSSAHSTRLTLARVCVYMRNGYSEAKCTRLMLQIVWVHDSKLVNTKIKV